MARARNTPVVNWSRFPSISFRGLLSQRAYISADVTSVKKWRYDDNPQAACSPTHNESGTHRWKLSDFSTYDLQPPPIRSRPPRISLEHQPIFILGLREGRRRDVGKSRRRLGMGACLGALLRCSVDNGASASRATRVGGRVVGWYKGRRLYVYDEEPLSCLFSPFPGRCSSSS